MIIRPLQNCTVIVTRPANAGQSLLSRLDNTGARTIHMPVMRIEPLTIEPVAATADIIIFISANAVNHGLAALGGAQALLTAQKGGSKILAIGSSTAQALQQQEITTDNQYREQQVFDSESLLLDESLTNIKGRTVQIIRGVGGREVLQNTLTERGASIDIVEVYERCAADYLRTEPLADLLRRADAVTVASGQSLNLLRELALRECPAEFAELWPTIKLVLPSQRVLQSALKSGIINQPVVAQNATDTKMFTAVLRATRSKQAG